RPVSARQTAGAETAKRVRDLRPDQRRLRQARRWGRTAPGAATARMSRYLVTGGAGFIGSHLCDALIARGDTVRVLDDFSTGHHANLPIGVELIVGDIADPPTALRATEGADGCFHLAAIASVE